MGAWPWSRDPLNFWAITANSSKTVKAMDFKFDTRSQGQSGYDTQNFSQNGVFKNLLGGDMHSHERLLVFLIVQRSRCVKTCVIICKYVYN